MADVCSEHSGVCANMKQLQKDTDRNSDSIHTLEEAVIKLTIWIEEARKKVTEPNKFWDPGTKKLAVKLTFILILVVVSLLTGINVYDKLDIKP